MDKAGGASMLNHHGRILNATAARMTPGFEMSIFEMVLTPTTRRTRVRETSHILQCLPTLRDNHSCVKNRIYNNRSLTGNHDLSDVTCMVSMAVFFSKYGTRVTVKQQH